MVLTCAHSISAPCCTAHPGRHRGNLHRTRKSGASKRQRATFTVTNSAITRSKAQVGSSRFFAMANYSSRRCDSEEHARRVAEMAKGNCLRRDCFVIEKGGD